MRVSTDALGFHLAFTVEPRDAAAGSGFLVRLRERLRRRAEPGVEQMSDAALAELGLRPEDVPGHPRRDPVLRTALSCMDVPFWPGIALDRPEDRAR
jgi:uncharacterized protein YjiS (DUF1127 family)